MRWIHHPLLPYAGILCLCATAQLLDDERKVLLPAFGPCHPNPTRHVVLRADQSCYTSCRSIDDGSTQFFGRKWQPRSHHTAHVFKQLSEKAPLDLDIFSIPVDFIASFGFYLNAPESITENLCKRFFPLTKRLSKHPSLVPMNQSPPASPAVCGINQGIGLIVSTIVLVTLTAIIVAMRFAVRLWLVKDIRWDDWTILLALVGFIIRALSRQWAI